MGTIVPNIAITCKEAGIDPKTVDWESIDRHKDKLRNRSQDKSGLGFLTGLMIGRSI